MSSGRAGTKILLLHFLLFSRNFFFIEGILAQGGLTLEVARPFLLFLRQAARKGGDIVGGDGYKGFGAPKVCVCLKERARARVCDQKLSTPMRDICQIHTHIFICVARTRTHIHTPKGEDKKEVKSGFSRAKEENPQVVYCLFQRMSAVK